MKLMLLGVALIIVIGVQSIHDAISKEDSHPILFYGVLIAIACFILGLFQ